MNLSLRVNCLAVIWITIIGGSFAVEVTITNGTLAGAIMRSRSGREFSAFLGIPYARPPINELRFKSPEPPSAWSGVRQATKDGANCIQGSNEVFNYNPSGEYSEDCLFLNVYTPKTTGFNNTNEQYPVMVWIHGGGYYSGSSHSGLYGPDFLMDKNIVLVTFNYRIGAFGFLSTGDSVAHGNQGLKDQRQALRWVKENIADFGGDPNSVTIFGESAGAVSVHYLIISQSAKGLFHKAITESGTSLAPWGFYSFATARAQAFRVGTELGCRRDSSEGLIACLQSLSSDQIQSRYDAWLAGQTDILPFFRPVVEVNHEDALLVEDPIDALTNGRFNKVPWLNGVNAQEGSLAAAILYGAQGQAAVKVFNDFFDQFVPKFFAFNEQCSTQQQMTNSKRIRQYYFQEEPINDDTRFKYIDMTSDSFFIYSSTLAVKKARQQLNSTIYYYFFNYRSGFSWSGPLGAPGVNYGVCHADELQYLFPIRRAKAPNVAYTHDDIKMIDMMTTLWTNFAIYGNPTPEGTEVLPDRWIPVQTEALEYLKINGPDQSSMSKTIYGDRMKFWGSLSCDAGLARRSNRPSLAT